MSASRRPPFRAGDPLAAELGKKGGHVVQEQRRRKAASDPLTRGLLGDLIGYTTSDWFDRLGLTEPSWATWRVVGKVLDGIPLSADEVALYHQLSGRTTLPSRLLEVLCLFGRGSGKTKFMPLQAMRAAFRGYTIRGIARVLLLAYVRDQASLAFEYLEGFVDGDAELRKLVSGRTRSSLTLAHGVRIETIASNWRTVRGYSIAAALCDELAFWWNEETNANPAGEVLRALRPGLGKVSASRLLIATSPWTEEGPAYEMHERYWGKDDAAHALVLRGATLVLNPAYDRARIALEEQEDPESAAAEYGAAWRVAGGSLVHPAVVDAAIEKGVVERAPEPPLGDDMYVAAVDLSGGTGEDSAALSICHVEEDEERKVDVAVQDVLREWVPRFDPAVMVAEMCRECQRFGITEVVGDGFSQGFAASEFRKHGVQYVVAERKTAESLLDSIAILNTRRARLLDNAKTRKQWLNLKRDYASGGRPTILETRKHDDLAVVTARGIVALLGLGEVPDPKRYALQFG